MTRIRVGPVDIRTDMDLSYKQLRRLVIEAGALAAKVENGSAAEPNPVAQPIGFAAHVERAPDPEPEARFTDDD